MNIVKENDSKIDNAVEERGAQAEKLHGYINVSLQTDTLCGKSLNDSHCLVKRGLSDLNSLKLTQVV